MSFSKTPPGLEGYYWWRRDNEARSEILFYYGESFPNVMLLERDESFPLQELIDWCPEAEFAGPIPEPTS